MSKYTPEIQTLANDVLAKMRQRLPGAVQIVYDNYNALVIGFGPSERASEAIFSMAVYPRWINLFFLDGAGLPDPENLLQGGGKTVRSIKLKDAATLDQPGVRKLMQEALKRADSPISKKTPGRLIIKSISPKQRPRRPKPY